LARLKNIGEFLVSRAAFMYSATRCLFERDTSDQRGHALSEVYASATPIVCRQRETLQTIDVHLQHAEETFHR
jgi:hypothetical protein